jgi:hypothetical protein
MEYKNLTGRDLTALRAERITVLEGEHFRLALRREEATEVNDFEAFSAQMAELERRIELHRADEAPIDSRADLASEQADASS